VGELYTIERRTKIMIGSDLLRYAKDQKYMVWDVETEGLNLFYHRPWEIAWIIFKDNQVLERYHAFIKWDDLNISEDAARITNFDKKEYLAKARPPAEVLKEFETRLNNPELKIIGHNLYFDSFMHRNWRRELGLPEDFKWMDRHIDTNVLSKAFKKGWKPDLENYVQWQWRVQDYIEKGLKTSIKAMATELGLEYEDYKAHRADYDVAINMNLFNQLKWKIEI
jgi:DNA polymerase III alpha subunit (gram-positive type)